MTSPFCTTVSPGMKSQVAAAAARRRRWERLNENITGSEQHMWYDAWHRKTSSRSPSGSTFNRFASLACRNTIRNAIRQEFKVIQAHTSNRSANGNWWKIMEINENWLHNIGRNLKWTPSRSTFCSAVEACLKDDSRSTWERDPEDLLHHVGEKPQLAAYDLFVECSFSNSIGHTGYNIMPYYRKHATTPRRMLFDHATYPLLANVV